MNNKQKIIYLYFIILPIIDVITSLITRFTDIHLSLGIMVKGLTMIISVLYTIIWSKSKYQKLSKYYLLILNIYILLYFITKIDILSVHNIFFELSSQLHYLYYPIMIIGVFNIFEDFKIPKEIIQKILVFNCILYTCLLLIPYITSTSFNSYRWDNVKGQNGWFYSANETGAICILLLSSIYYLLDNKNILKVLLIFPILLSISLIGTKVSYLGMIIVTIASVITYLAQKKKDGLKISILIVIMLSIVCTLSPAISNLENSISVMNETKETTERKYKYESIDDITKNAVISKIVKIGLNGRESFFLKNYSIYEESSILDKLFGLGWTNRESINYDLYKKLIEIDYLDILIHYGIIGFIIYFMPLIYLFIRMIKLKTSKTKEFWLYFLILLLELFISSFAGHVLSAPAVSIYLVLIMYLIKLNVTKKEINALKEKEITILALHLGYGGIEQYINSLSNMLIDDYDINIISTYKLSTKPAFNFNDKIKITYLMNIGPNKEELTKAIKNKNIIKTIKESIKSIKILYLKKVLNIKAIKNINSKYIITTRDYHNTLVGKYAKKGIIKIATEHNYHNNDKKYVRKVVSSVKNFNYFVLVSKTLKEFYKERVKGPKCVYIPNIIDNLPDKKSNLDKNNLISIGRLEKVKGFDDLIDIVRLIKKDMPNIKLYLLGDGSERNNLETTIKNNNLEKNIILTGFLSKKDMAEYLQKSKLYIMTSHSESFGLVLIEAMSFGIPCIAFDSADGAKELLKNDVGILIENRDKEKMAKKIIELLNNQNKIKKISEISYNYVKNYLPKNIKNKWLDILK